VPKSAKRQLLHAEPLASHLVSNDGEKSGMTLPLGLHQLPQKITMGKQHKTKPNPIPEGSQDQVFGLCSSERSTSRISPLAQH